MLNDLFHRIYHACNTLGRVRITSADFYRQNRSIMIDVISEIHDDRYRCDLGRSRQITTAVKGFIPYVSEVTSIILTTGQCYVHATIDIPNNCQLCPQRFLPFPFKFWESNIPWWPPNPYQHSFLEMPYHHTTAPFELKKVGRINKRKSISFKDARTKRKS